MSRRDKLIQQIVHRPPTASFSDVRKVLEMFGWEHASTKGSHARFTKKGQRSIIVPTHNNTVGRVYLDQICNRLELDAETEAP